MQTGLGRWVSGAGCVGVGASQLWVDDYGHRVGVHVELDVELWEHSARCMCMNQLRRIAVHYLAPT